MALPTRFTRFAAAILLVFGFSGQSADAGDLPADPLGWPAVTSANKPWTRWWWLGSAVDKRNLTQELEDFAKTGLGGVEICPIYGAVGAEDRSLKFLSPEWMEMLAHTTTEARRLGLGVDMTTGTGWPFGGPQVTPEIASTGLTLIRNEAAGGEEFTLTLPKGTLQCLRAFPESGSYVDLAPMVKDGKLDWLPPTGKWNILGLVSQSPIQKVKRAAPGGEGNVLDPFSVRAMTAYLAAFDKAFENYTAPMPRAQFHDSFEYYAAEWTPAFTDEFLAARGYDLRDRLPAFAGIGDPDTVARVRADYRETLSELHLAYLSRWHDWAKSHGEITRNQAHGSPGNLLDHYAVSEIPETEIFRHVDENQIPMMRIPVSAAHSKGDQLVSGETFTWLDEHFQVTPEKLKEAADFVFLGGVNHIFFHGIPYSPDDAKWPGWLFYASTHMGRNGGLWHDLSAFTGYIQRCQSILQEGKASLRRVALLSDPRPLAQQPGKTPAVHRPQPGSLALAHHVLQDFPGVVEQGDHLRLRERRDVSEGYRQGWEILLGGNSFSALVLPGVNRLQPATMQRILNLTAQGGHLIVLGGWPTEVPGFHQAKERRDELIALKAKYAGADNVFPTPEAMLPRLRDLGAHIEDMTGFGLRFVRRFRDGGYDYFVVNRSDKPFHNGIDLAVPFKSAVVLDPWNPSRSRIAIPKMSSEADKAVMVRLEPGESVIIRTFTNRIMKGTGFNPNAEDRAIPIDGPWKIQFLEGGPVVPKPTEVTRLGSWTILPDPDVKNFSGTARYTTTFDLPAPLPASCKLDLGRVANTARVRVNHQALGISWCAPHVVDISKALKSGSNLLEIEVTNLAANRIADLDRRKVPWKQFP